MKKIGLALLLLAVITGCSNKPPTTTDLIGIWRGEDSANIELMSDGRFSVANLPAEFFNIPPDKYKGLLFSGTGRWKIASSRSSWDQMPFQIDLYFSSISDKTLIPEATFIISGSGMMENKAPWKYIFCWKGEEGGDRYKFNKQ